MNYITAGEAAQKWYITRRTITYHLAAGHIPGAVKKGKLWLIPADARRPVDKRRRKPALPGRSLSLSLSSDLAEVIVATAAPLPAYTRDALLEAVQEERLRLIYEVDLAYLQGSFARVLDCFRITEGDDAARLRICPAAVAAAISMGDYDAYTEIETYLRQCVKNYPRSEIAAMAELALATAAVSMFAPHMAPAWLKEGDFSALVPQVRLYALYLRAKYFQCTGEYSAMLAVAQTALAFSGPEYTLTSPGIYLRLTCAMASFALGREGDARRWLLEAMRIALPYGFITPFAEVATSLGGLVERCLEREFPEYYKTVICQWKGTFPNWVTFHNRFTRDNITYVLSLREFHIAQLIARRVPYAEVAKQYCISVGRLRNIMQEVYNKLGVSDRDGLAEYILGLKKT